MLNPKESGEENDLGRLIKAVADYSEKARLLALNLAVAAAKTKPSHGNRRQLDDDLFRLVTRMTSVARQITEISSVAEKGFDPQRFKKSDRMLRLLLEKGVFNTDVISHLEKSLHEALTLAQRIAEHVGVELPESCRTQPS